MCKDRSAYCALADLGMEERVKGGWYVCVLCPAPTQISTHRSTALVCFASLLLLRLHGVELDRATWRAAYRAFKQAFVALSDTVRQKKLAKLLKRPLPKEFADALFTYEGFLHGIRRMRLSA